MGEMVPCISMTLQLPHCGVEDGVSLNVYMLRHTELRCGTDSCIRQHWQEGFHATSSIVSCNSIHVCIVLDVELLVRRRSNQPWLQLLTFSVDNGDIVPASLENQIHKNTRLQLCHLYINLYIILLWIIYQYIPLYSNYPSVGTVHDSLYIFLSSRAW